MLWQTFKKASLAPEVFHSKLGNTLQTQNTYIAREASFQSSKHIFKNYIYVLIKLIYHYCPRIEKHTVWYLRTTYAFLNSEMHPRKLSKSFIKFYSLFHLVVSSKECLDKLSDLKLWPFTKYITKLFF